MAGITDNVVDMGKAVLSLSLASIIRTSLGGIKQGRRSLKDTYAALSPFSPVKHGDGIKMFEQIPEVSLDVSGDDPKPVVLDLRFVDVDGAAPLRDVIAILTLAKQQNPQAALEFGTYFGSTTANLALNLPAAKIHTIDLPEEETRANPLTQNLQVDDEHLIRGRQLGKSFRGTPQELQIVQHQGDTASYDYSAIHDPVTFFLVDGSHTYEYVRNDTLKSFALAKGVSTFLWHDCDIYHTGVLRWLVEMIHAGLPVAHVKGTSLAYMKIDAQDPRVERLLTAANTSTTPPTH